METWLACLVALLGTACVAVFGMRSAPEMSFVAENFGGFVGVTKGLPVAAAVAKEASTFGYHQQ